MDQPEWFFSSLAQVVAGLSGFIGGFLLLRLLETTREWNLLEERLRQRQAAWTRARHKDEAFRNQDRHHRGPFTGERRKASEAESAAWRDLYETLQDRDAASMPPQLTLAIVGVSIFALVGTLGPLFSLEDPTIDKKLPWLVGLALLFLALLGMIYFGSLQALGSLKNFELYPMTEWRLEDYELWIEGMKELDEEEHRKKEDDDDGAD